MSGDVRGRRLPSERVVVESPMSFSGATRRIWQWPGRARNTGVKVLLALVVPIVMIGAWTLILCWYATFGLLVVPWRLVRRRSRRRRRRNLRHRELVDAMRRGGR